MPVVARRTWRAFSISTGRGSRPAMCSARMRSRPSTVAFRASLARHASLLDRREHAGKVRRCHGDLHLRNICLLDGDAVPVRLHRVQRPDRDGRRALRPCLPAHGPVASRLPRTRQSGHEPISRRGGRRGRLRPAALLHGRSGSRARACHCNAGRGGRRPIRRPCRRSQILFRSRKDPAWRPPARGLSRSAASAAPARRRSRRRWRRMSAHRPAPVSWRATASARPCTACRPKPACRTRHTGPRFPRRSIARWHGARGSFSRRAGRSSPTPFSTGRQTGSASRRQAARPRLAMAGRLARGRPGRALAARQRTQGWTVGRDRRHSVAAASAACERNHMAQSRRRSHGGGHRCRDTEARRPVKFHRCSRLDTDLRISLNLDRA